MNTRCRIVDLCFSSISSWLPIFCSCSRTSSIILPNAPPYIKPHDKFFSKIKARKMFVSPIETVCFLLPDNESNETYHTEVYLFHTLAKERVDLNSAAVRVLSLLRGVVSEVREKRRGTNRTRSKSKKHGKPYF